MEEGGADAVGEGEEMGLSLDDGEQPAWPVDDSAIRQETWEKQVGCSGQSGLAWVIHQYPLLAVVTVQCFIVCQPLFSFASFPAFDFCNT